MHCPPLNSIVLLAPCSLLALAVARPAQTLAPAPAAPAEESLVGTPCFEGTGGPTGDFDWVVQAGDIFFFDTTLTQIVGGPGGNPTQVQNAVNGVVDVRHLTVEEGGEIRVMGPNPMTILATGDVTIRGLVDVSGFAAHDTATLNTGNVMENGGAGSAGGGRGGNANVVTNNSSPRGGRGRGAFGQIDGGGQGGETGYAPAALGIDSRRPGGGGGGRFKDRGQLAAGPGTDGHPNSTGAESGLMPARGGAAGPSPFLDAKDTNDFFGLRPVVGNHGQLIGVLRGELAAVWAGAGGGGGGNADPASTFPTPNWNAASDEKGGAGGGAGGGLHVQALGRIVFGAGGQIRANGANGALGENTNFLDHIGGTGGGGSGGHVVLETALFIDFTDGGATPSNQTFDWIQAVGAPLRTGPTQFVNPCCRGYSNGGAGGPGLVQLHVPDPVAQPGTSSAQSDIVVPAAVAAARFPLDELASPGALAMFLSCEPVPRGTAGWVGVGGMGARAAFLRVLLGAALPGGDDAHGARFDPLEMTVPYRF